MHKGVEKGNIEHQSIPNQIETNILTCSWDHIFQVEEEEMEASGGHPAQASSGLNSQMQGSNQAEASTQHSSEAENDPGKRGCQYTSLSCISIML